MFRLYLFRLCPFRRCLFRVHRFRRCLFNLYRFRLCLFRRLFLFRRSFCQTMFSQTVYFQTVFSDIVSSNILCQTIHISIFNFQIFSHISILCRNCLLNRFQKKRQNNAKFTSVSLISNRHSDVSIWPQMAVSKHHAVTLVPALAILLEQEVVKPIFSCLLARWFGLGFSLAFISSSPMLAFGWMSCAAPWVSCDQPQCHRGSFELLQQQHAAKTRIQPSAKM